MKAGINGENKAFDDLGKHYSGPKIWKKIVMSLCSDPTPGFLTFETLGLACCLISNLSYISPSPSAITVMGDSLYYY